MNDPYENTSESSAEAAKAMMETSRQYKSAISVPVFGKIPLSLSDIISDLKVRENPPLWAQFFKYGICGVLSVIILILTVQFIEHSFPEFLDKKALSDSQFQLNLTIALFCAFVPSNFFAYFSNRMFVFTPGRHTFFKEMSYFTIISAISFAGGELGKRAIVSAQPDNPYIVLLATLSFAISSALVNFIARKYLVFSKESGAIEINPTNSI